MSHYQLLNNHQNLHTYNRDSNPVVIEPVPQPFHRPHYRGPVTVGHNIAPGSINRTDNDRIVEGNSLKVQRQRYAQKILNEGYRLPRMHRKAHDNLPAPDAVERKAERAIFKKVKPRSAAYRCIPKFQGKPRSDGRRRFGRGPNLIPGESQKRIKFDAQLPSGNITEVRYKRIRGQRDPSTTDRAADPVQRKQFRVTPRVQNTQNPGGALRRKERQRQAQSEPVLKPHVQYSIRNLRNGPQANAIEMQSKYQHVEINQSIPIVRPTVGDANAVIQVKNAMPVPITNRTIPIYPFRVNGRIYQNPTIVHRGSEIAAR